MTRQEIRLLQIATDELHRVVSAAARASASSPTIMHPSAREAVIAAVPEAIDQYLGELLSMGLLEVEEES